MILAELIQRVQSLYSKGVQSDDTRLSSRHIYSKILTVRAKLLEQTLNKRQKVAQWDYQTISCLRIVEVPIAECPCAIPSGCTVFRSELPLPGVLTNLNRHFIQSVTNLDGSIIFSEVNWTEKKYKNGAKYTKKSPDYFIRNGYLYVTTPKKIKALTVTALFEDPFVAEQFNICCTNPDSCESPLDRDFPISQADIDTIIEMSVQELIGVFNSNMEDQRNNTSDNLSEQTK